MSGRTLAQLSETIARASAQLESRLKDQGIESPTVNDISTTPDLSQLDAEAASSLAEAARELLTLSQGPRMTLGFHALAVHDASSLGVLVDFNIPNLVPLSGSATYTELSAASGLDEDRLTRIIRYAALNNIFVESPPGTIRHTALSAHLVRHPPFCDFIRSLALIFNPTNACIPPALRAYPSTVSMREAAHGVARHTDATFYQWLDEEENARMRRVFDVGMEGISRGGQRLQDSDLRAYPWAEKLGTNAKVVDVGGSGGHFSYDLAEMNPGFEIVVQDLPRVIRGIEEAADAPTAANVTHQSHDFFREQPVVGADAYFLRHIFHNHPDKECVDIVKALLPALKPGARVLISEYIVPPYEELDSRGPGTRAMRQMDLMTMALFNAKERTKDEMAAIFQQASPDLVLRDTYQLAEDPRGCVFEAAYKIES